MKRKRFIPIYEPNLKGNEKKYVLDCLNSNWISARGKYGRLFEKSMENYVGNVYATGCSNGTVALHLALLVLNIGPGDEVIVPSFTYIASVNAIKYVGATPVFVDSDSDSWNVNIGDIEKKITPRTKAIMAVHIYGVPCAIDEILQIANNYSLKVVEDCAEALGSNYKGRHVGVSSDIATLSFFGNKTITTGEGGMVFSKCPELIKMVAHLKNQSVSETDYFWHDGVGYNYRLTNIASAIGLAQLEKIDKILETKQNLAKTYRDALGSERDIKFQMVESHSTSSYWLNVVKFKTSDQKKQVENFLTECGVEVRPGFPLVSDMPPYKNQSTQNLVCARDISETSLCLPSYPGLSEEDIKYIVDNLLKALSHF